jgi:hypothetical protein
MDVEYSAIRLSARRPKSQVMESEDRLRGWMGDAGLIAQKP